MNVLFFGDIVGKIGRKALAKTLPSLKEKFKPDLILANGENLAHGKGLTLKTVKEIINLGVDYLTSGNHFFAKSEEIEKIIKEKMPVLRPANFPLSFKGEGDVILSKGKNKILLINLLGEAFIKSEKIILSNPFLKVEEILLNNFQKIKIIIVDFHAEVTSEKKAMSYWLDSKVSLLVGTHTHVQTSDEKISPGGTAYITDLGMVGAEDSVIGVKKESSLDYLLGKTEKLKIDIPEKGLAIVQGVFVEIDEKSGKAKEIKRINEEILVD